MGGACLSFSKWWVPPADGTPPCGGWGWAKSGLVDLRGRAIPPHPLFSPLCWSVGEWVPLELNPPPVGVGQVLWVPAKSGCLPFSSPPPRRPVAKKSVASQTACPCPNKCPSTIDTPPHTVRGFMDRVIDAQRRPRPTLLRGARGDEVRARTRACVCTRRWRTWQSNNTSV